MLARGFVGLQANLRFAFNSNQVDTPQLHVGFVCLVAARVG